MEKWQSRDLISRQAPKPIISQLWPGAFPGVNVVVRNKLIFARQFNLVLRTTRTNKANVDDGKAVSGQRQHSDASYHDIMTHTQSVTEPPGEE